jgi:hypothetical protein
MLLDGDEMVKRMLRELRTGIYADEPAKLLNLEAYVGFKGAEIEDLLPAKFFAKIIDRFERSAEQPFEDEVLEGRPIVDQTLSWAKAQGPRLSDLEGGDRKAC